MIRQSTFLGAMLTFLLAAASAHAYPKVTFGPPKDGKIDNLVPIMAQSARCCAQSDVHGLIAFGHDHTYADAHVSVVKLDGKGTPLAYAMPIKLHRPDALAKFPNQANGLAFHPKLPLLYVWQEIQIHYANPPAPQPPELDKNFNHLQVFNVSGETPQLVFSLCRGLEFIYGQAGGAVAVDDSGSYLYVPNLREVKNAGSMRMGRYTLDADGLPVLPDGDKDAKSPAPARAKRLMELNTANPVMPQIMTPIEYVYLFPNNGQGHGITFHPVGKEAVIAGIQQGFVTWRPEDKNATLSGLNLPYYGFTQFCVHPTLPVLFATASYQKVDSFYRVEHADGNLSLLPRQYIIPESRLSGPPAVLSKSRKVAIGGQNLVYCVDLDDKGMPIGDVIQTRVPCPAVRALVYSVRFDRVYVGVDVSK